MIIKFLNATTYFCIVIIVTFLFICEIHIYPYTEFPVDRKLVLFLSPNFYFCKIDHFVVCSTE